MSKRGSGAAKAFVAGGKNDPAMKPIDRNSLPKLEGTPKQVAWAQDIRDEFIKSEIVKTQKMYKEGIDALKEYKKTSPEKYKEEKERREYLASGRRAYIEAARIILNNTKSAKKIIDSRKYLGDVVSEVADAVEKKKTREQIKSIIADWM